MEKIWQKININRKLITQILKMCYSINITNFKNVLPHAEPYIIQVVKANVNGVFLYTTPKPGWCGVATLNTADFKLERVQEISC